MNNEIKKQKIELKKGYYLIIASKDAGAFDLIYLYNKNDELTKTTANKYIMIELLKACNLNNKKVEKTLLNCK